MLETTGKESRNHERKMPFANHFKSHRLRLCCALSEENNYIFAQSVIRASVV